MANSRNIKLGENNQSALNLLNVVTRIFEENKIKYVLDCGTLLGIVRENRLLPWDNDLDLSFFCDSEKEILSLKKMVRQAGLYPQIKYQEKDDHPLNKGDIRLLKIFNKGIFSRDRIHVDCFLMKRASKESFVCAYGGSAHYVRVEIPAKFYNDLDTINFNGKNFFTPKHVTEYLTYRYGDWETPISDGSYDYRKDDRSIVFSKIIENEKN